MKIFVVLAILCLALSKSVPALAARRPVIQTGLVVHSKKDMHHYTKGALVANAETKKKVVSIVPNSIKNGVASALATAVVKVVLQPFDTIKTVQQLQEGVKLSALATGVQIVKTRGVKSLWSGVGITVIGSAPSVACYFGVYSAAKTRLIPLFPVHFRLLAIALSAIIGNSLASILRVPYETFKQRIQAGEHDTIMEALSYTVNHEGLIGLFGQGKLSSQIMRDVPYAVITLVTYEILQAYLARRSAAKIDALLTQTAELAVSAVDTVGIDGELVSDPEIGTDVDDTVPLTGTAAGDSACTMRSPQSAVPSTTKSTATVSQGLVLSKNAKKLQDGFCGSLAGGLGAFCTTPMDVVKTRLMSSTNKHLSALAATLSILKNEGMMTFFVGTSSRLLHKIPANFLFFLCYESFRTLLGVESEEDVATKLANTALKVAVDTKPQSVVVDGTTGKCPHNGSSSSAAAGAAGVGGVCTRRRGSNDDDRSSTATVESTTDVEEVVKKGGDVLSEAIDAVTVMDSD